MLTVQQRALLDRLFEGAVGLPPEQQPAYLSRNCPDPAVRRELESLLAFASRPLEGITEAIGQVAESLAAPDFMGLRVGPHRLTGRIGQGGMGAVYRAVRDDDQFEKTVAIKMLRFPDGDPAMLQRFRHERQILASLEHPHIARLLDGGAWVPPGSAESQPYIVMEFVEGLPLTAYCEAKKLTIRQRLVLFRQICDALSYAHRQLVIHRDIKPGNILVTPDGTPKLLDFGVAKLLDPEMGHGAGTRTSTGLFAMTPDYASPEQVRGEPVSTVTDVYSLGAVLYELLTGRRPHQLATYGPVEIAREICEREVAPPGIGGDPDVIVLKALQKEPARRYQSVEQFSEDVRRYLEGLPIIARPDTLAYRSRKFVERHWLGLGAVAAVFLALVGGIGVSAWEAKRANGERSRAVAEKQRADTEASTAKAVNEFLRKDLLAQAGASAQAGPDNKPDPDLKVRVALDRAAARIAGKFQGQPAVEASIRQTIGRTYQDLGLFPEAQQQLERALELLRRTLGEERPDVSSGMSDLAGLYILQGKYAQARPLLTRLLEIRRRILGREHHDTLTTMSDLGELYSYEGNDAQAEPLMAEALEAQRRVLGAEHPETVATMSNLGVEYRVLGEYAQAELLLINTVEIRERLLGPEHPDTLASAYELAVVYLRQGKYGQAEPLLTNVLKNYRLVLGAEHPFTLIAMSGLVSLYQAEGKYPQAQALQTELLEARRRVLGGEHPDTLAAINSLAELYRREGKYEQAETLFGEVAETRRRVLGAQHRDTIVALIWLGRVRIQQAKYASAELPLREALSNYEKSNSDLWHRYHTQNLLGASLAGQQKYREAEPLLLHGYQGMLQRQAAIPVDSRSAVEEAGERIVRLYRDWGRPEEAAEWRERTHTANPAPLK